MNLKFLLISLLVISATVLSAQHRFGVKASYGHVESRTESRLIIKDDQAVRLELTYVDSSPMLAYGVFSQHNFGWVWLQNDLTYSTFKQEFSLKSFIETDEVLKTDKYFETNKYIDFSVMSGIRFNRFRYGVGPIFHFFGSIDSELSELDFYSQDIRWITAGFQGGIGYDFDNIHIDFKFESIFRAAGDHIKFNDGRIVQFRKRNQLLSLAVGFSF